MLVFYIYIFIFIYIKRLSHIDKHSLKPMPGGVQRPKWPLKSLSTQAILRLCEMQIMDIL